MSKESTHIRIDKDLKQQLQTLARCDETVNDVIRRLVNDRPNISNKDNNEVNNPPEPVTNEIHKKLTDLYQRVVVLETGSKMDGDYIDVLDSRVQRLETRIDSVYLVAQKLHPLLEYAKSMKSSELPVPESDPYVNIEPDQQEEYANNEQKTETPSSFKVNNTVNIIEKGTTYEWIIVTDEIRSLLVTRVGDLQKSGMSYEKIGKLIGMGKGRISELHQGKMKKIHRPQYEALMKTL